MKRRLLVLTRIELVSVMSVATVFGYQVGRRKERRRALKAIQTIKVNVDSVNEEMDNIIKNHTQKEEA